MPSRGEGTALPPGRDGWMGPLMWNLNDFAQEHRNPLVSLFPKT